MIAARYSRRGLLTMLSGSVVSACTPFEKTSPFWGTISAGIDPPDAAAISREYAEKLPYASMMAWFEGGAKAMIVLAEASPDGRLTWHSAEGQSITTYGAFVVKAIGTELELRDTRIVGLPDTDLRRLGNARVIRSLDVLAEGDRVQVAIESTFERRDRERIDILGVEKNVVEIVERVRSGGKRRYDNRYWVDDATGFCWKSRQTVVPRLPPLNLEVLKPAAV